MKGHLLMSLKELRRKTMLEGVKDGRLTLAEAARRLELSYRQTLRSWRRFQEKGDAGLVHRRRGQPSNRAKRPEFRQAVLKRYQERYEGFGPTLAAEKLAAEGYRLDHETLRRWLLAEGLWKKQRRRRKHRCRRERRAHFGELVQLDGSHHRWFGPHQRQCCLMNMVDDATGVSLALLAEQETTAAAMGLLWRWIERYGVPQALYTDRKNTFVTDRPPTLEEQLADQAPLTAFGKACAKLGIKIIPANSPQAKGRVERKHGVLQDRLVKELALKQIVDLEGANELLRDGFGDHRSCKFAQPPRSPRDFHHPVPEHIELAEVFCFEEQRTVANDWTIRYHNQFFQIEADNKPLPRPRDKVVVRTLLDGALELLHRDKPLSFTPIAKRRPQAKRETPHHPEAHAEPQQWKPPANHPWRRFHLGKTAAQSK